MYSFKLTMSAVICQTVQSSLSVPPHTKMHGSLHWVSFPTDGLLNHPHHPTTSLSQPSGSTKKQNNKPPTLRVVASEPYPSLAHRDDSMAVPPAPPHTHASPSRIASTDAHDLKSHQQHNTHDKAEVPFPGHARTQSTSVISEPTADHGSRSARRSRRTRAASSSNVEHNPRSRPRLPSMLATVLTQSKAPAQPRESTNDPDLLGSFAPTTSPRPRLRSLLSGTKAPPEFSGALSSSSSSPSQLSTPSARRPSALRVSHGYGTEPRRRHRSDAPRAGTTQHWRSASDAPPIDPPGSPDLPSICRTPSSYSSSDNFPTAPSSAGPTTPVHTGPTLPTSTLKMVRRKSEASSLHPVLENLERTSLFRVVTACATCGKCGSNFPCCPKCGEMWCSRACRLQKGNGKKHICSKTAA
uniref:Type III secretion system ATPase n=1 Tax=Ganoderma boninense TaxID=34458 RepID=A0A5K1K3M9_9APHY|nr:Type III secretion system ATPase [Ganoderma boninense]